MAKYPDTHNKYPVTPKAYPVLPKAYPSTVASYPSAALPINPSSVTGYALDLDADIGITLGSTPLATGTIPPACTLTGTLVLAVNFRAEITTGGTLPGTPPLFRYSADGGATWIASGVTAASTVALAGAMSGATLNMPAATYLTDNVYVGLVAACADQSPSAAHATQATASIQGTYKTADENFNGHGSLGFARLDNCLNIAASLGLRHIFAVANSPYTSATTFVDGYCMLLSAAPSFALNAIFFGQFTSNDWRTGDDLNGVIKCDGVTTDTALTTTVANQPHVYSKLLDALKTVATWRIGSENTTNRHWRGNVARIVGFDVPLSASDEAGVLLYLKQRYGTP